MASSDNIIAVRDRTSFNAAGVFLLALATVAAGWFFIDGLDALLLAWQTPEYSHGPLIPVLSALMFLRELKQYPPQDGPVPDRDGAALDALVNDPWSELPVEDRSAIARVVRDAIESRARAVGVRLAP